MIGREPSGASGVTERRADAPPDAPPREVAIRWGIGCLVGAVSLVGVLLLSVLLAFYLQPPAWVQVVVGLVLVAGAASLTWLVATAWGRADSPDPGRRADRPTDGA